MENTWRMIHYIKISSGPVGIELEPSAYEVGLIPCLGVEGPYQWSLGDTDSLVVEWEMKMCLLLNVDRSFRLTYFNVFVKCGIKMIFLIAREITFFISSNTLHACPRRIGKSTLWERASLFSNSLGYWKAIDCFLISLTLRGLIWIRFEVC